MLIRKAATVFVGLLLVSQVMAQSDLRIIREGGKAVAIFVPVEPEQPMQVFLEGSDHPLLGKLQADIGGFTFTPAIAFRPGSTYLVKQGNRLSARFRIEKEEATPPEIISISPAADTVPANILKFYIRFSGPMSAGDPYPHVHLLDENGDTLRGAFLYQMPALWNGDNTLLTLWLDPGRIKRDLLLNQRYGSPLDEGRKYQLAVSSNWKSVRGLPLRSAVCKTFYTTAVDREKPDINDWKIDTPHAETSDPLRIQFPEPMDYLSTMGRIKILLGGEEVKGEEAMMGNETEWSFLPEKSWKKGTYKVRIVPVMEDLAGNNLNRLFDRDISQDEAFEKEFYELEFAVE